MFVLQAQGSRPLYQVDDGLAENVHVEWLDDVGVGTRGESSQTIFVHTHCRQHHYGHMAGGEVRAQAHAERIAIHVWHHHVAEYQVGHAAHNFRESLSPVGEGFDLIVVAEFLHQIVAYLLVVLGNHQEGALTGGRLDGFFCRLVAVLHFSQCQLFCRFYVGFGHHLVGLQVS